MYGFHVRGIHSGLAFGLPCISTKPAHILPTTYEPAAPQDRVGHDKTQKEIQIFVDHNYCLDHDAQVSLVTKHGQWATRRHRLNDRGDESSIQARQKSVETVGILQDLRGGPFLVKAPDASVNDEYEVVHWATLLEGAERAWRADKHKTNKAVQMSMLEGLNHCKIYSQRTPDDVIIFLKSTGNLLNSEVTETTFLEVWRETPRVEAAWARRKTAMGWTTLSVGVTALDDMKFKFVDGLLPNRFPKYRHYENCQYFHKEAQKVVVQTPDGEKSVWDILVARCQAEVEMTSGKAVNHTLVFNSAAAILRKLRNSHPEYIVDIIMLVLPILGQPLGS